MQTITKLGFIDIDGGDPIMSAYWSRSKLVPGPSYGKKALATTDQAIRMWSTLSTTTGIAKSPFWYLFRVPAGSSANRISH